jgi:hypothetical protein
MNERMIYKTRSGRYKSFASTLKILGHLSIPPNRHIRRIDAVDVR